MTTLIVDDNATNRRVLEEILRSWGMRVTAAESGKAALAAMREAKRHNQVKLVLLDLMMPEMDGFDLAEQIRAEAGFGEPKMIMISSAGRPGDMERCRQLGIGRYLMKPIIQSELLNAMMDTLGAVVADEPVSQTAAGPRLRVLLAEDGLINQRVAVGFLQQFGHDVMVASNGKEAVRMFTEGSFDVVLMDVQMPELDGCEATRAIRDLEKNWSGHIPIIAMTAAAMKGDRERCLEAGMDGYIAKPIDPDKLSKVLKEFSPVSVRPRSPAAADILASDTGSWQKDGARDPATTDVFDFEAATNRIPGGIGAVKELAHVLLEECPKLMVEIHNSLSEKDATRLQRSAHTLKASAAVFEAKPVVTAAEKLERLGREGNLGDAEHGLATLEMEVARLCEAMAQVLDNSQY
jgi:CheY-like chemotaxis protein